MPKKLTPYGFSKEFSSVVQLNVLLSRSIEQEALTEHFFNWIMRTGEIYFKHRDEIEKRKQRYSQ